MGKPLKFPTVKDLDKAIDAYFAERSKIEVLPNGDIKQKPITVTGLALALDTTRETICDYGEKDGYSDSIRRARLRCENYAEERLYLGQATGPIFALKNYGWKDTQDVNQNNTGTTQVVINKSYASPKTE